MSESIYLVSYDIRDQKRLAKVHNAIRDYGVPRQYSVFECRLTDKDLVKMKDKLARIINHEHDQILIIPLCEGCYGGIEAIGMPKPKGISKVIIL